jgi:hypothetical protein
VRALDLTTVAATIVACSLSGCAKPQTAAQVHSLVGAREPAFSPDGREIAMTVGSGIAVMSATGGTARAVATGPGNDWHPVWSPDGKSLAFLSDRSGSPQVWMVRAADGTPRRLTTDSSGKSNPAWSPDGSLVAFTTIAGRYGKRVRAVSVADGTVRDLIESDADYAAWSPDGSRLVFARRSEAHNYDLWVMPAKGGAAVQLTDAEGMEFQPTWSPDGQQIAYTSYRYVPGEQGATDLFLVAASGGPPHQLTHTDEAEFDPSWTNDGQAIVFTSNLAGNTELRTIPPSGGPASPLLLTGLSFPGRGAGQLTVTVTEGGNPIACRISVQGSDGKFYGAADRFFRIANTGVGFFHADGPTLIDLPAGPATVRVTRGLEYRMVERTVEVPPGGARELTLAIERWADMASRGWYSGDNHIHANYTILDYRNRPEDIVLMAEAEDLNVSNLLIADFGGTPSFDWVEGFWDQRFFEGKPSGLSRGRTVLYWNEEFRSTVYGHMSLINLRELVTPLFSGFRGTPQFEDFPPNADIADRAHAQSGLVSYVHPFFASEAGVERYDAAEFKPDWSFQAGYEALELPVDVALGKVEALDLSTRLDTFDLTAVIYRRLLNCGFRLAVGAGTDVYADQKRNPPVGVERVYAFSTEPFSYGAYIDGLRNGRTFATNGPMITLSVDGQPIGSTVKVARPGTVTVRAEAQARFPMDRMEILVNGKAVQTVRAVGDRASLAFDGVVPVNSSAWIAVRVDGPRQPWLLSNNPLAAHSSPVYVLIGDQPIASATDARFFITWIDKLWELVDSRNRWSAPAHRTYVRDLFTRAQNVYRQILASDPSARRITRARPGLESAPVGKRREPALTDGRPQFH